MKKADLERYFEKSGDDHLITNCHVISNEHGFATFDVLPDAIMIYNEFGDGKHWETFFLNLARHHGIKTIRFTTKRNPKTYCRKYKAKVVAYILERDVL